MEKNTCLYITGLLLLLQVASSALIYYPQIPVDQITLYKAQVALDNWEKILQDTYGTPYERPTKIKQQTDLVVGELAKVSSQLAAYNNVILG